MNIALAILTVVMVMLVLYLSFYKQDNTDHETIAYEDEQKIEALEKELNEKNN